MAAMPEVLIFGYRRERVSRGVWQVVGIARRIQPGMGVIWREIHGSKTERTRESS
jgi:hypothetical protein